MLGEFNERVISIREAVNEKKSEKAPGLDGFKVWCLKKCDMPVYVRIVIETVELMFRHGRRTYGLAWAEWRMYIVHLHQRKVEKNEV